MADEKNGSVEESLELPFSNVVVQNEVGGENMFAKKDESNDEKRLKCENDHTYSRRTPSKKEAERKQTTPQIFCTMLIREFGVDGVLQCVICSKKIYIGCGTWNVIRHALAVHCGKKMYACKLCSNDYGLQKSLSQHIRRDHNVRDSVGDYMIDRKGNFKNGILRLLSKCYQKKEIRGGEENKEGDN